MSIEDMKKALSLIEVCISIAIITIILASIVNIYTQGYRNLRKSRVNTAVYNLARQVMEQYLDWDALDKLDSSASPCATDGTVVDTTAGSPYSPTNQPNCSEYVFTTITLNDVIYTPNLAIFDGPTDPNILKQLNVTISWVEDGVTKDFTLVTYKANY